MRSQRLSRTGADLRIALLLDLVYSVPVMNPFVDGGHTNGALSLAVASSNVDGTACDRYGLERVLPILTELNGSAAVSPQEHVAQRSWTPRCDSC